MSPGSDTIAAVATGAGGGIGIVRISGPDALPIAGRIFRGRAGRPLDSVAASRLVLGTILDPDSLEPIDEVLAVRMPAGRSYTGEPTVEIQGHGGRVVLEAVLQAALRGGARHAAPGEFTRRAFLSGRLDLAQAEAVAELICAEHEGARRTALRQLRGAAAGEIGSVRERLLDFVARVEAAIDFEEGEVPDDLPSPEQMIHLADEIRRLADQAGETTGTPTGVRVAIAGRANSGKSSIFNYLLDFERSIVTPAPGTTRDYIEERSLIGGASVTLIDTAGVRETDDPAEAEGVRRSLERIECSSVVVLVIDGAEPFHPEEGLLFDRVSDRAPLVVLSKSDLPLRLDPDALRARAAGADVFALSTVTGAGFPDFIAALASRSRSAGETDGQSAYVPNLRHRDALARTALHLDAAALQARSPDGYLDQVALELQAALAALGEMTGQTATEELLERIFSRFCVGK